MGLEFLCIDSGSARDLRRDPSWPSAREAIDLLDGDAVSMVRLSTVAGTSLSIGGGRNDQYVVSAIHSSGAATTLLHPGSTGPAVDIKHGRSRTAFPSDMVVPKTLVLRAAELFWRNGNFDSALTWKGVEPGIR